MKGVDLEKLNNAKKSQEFIDRINKYCNDMEYYQGLKFLLGLFSRDNIVLNAFDSSWYGVYEEAKVRIHLIEDTSIARQLSTNDQFFDLRELFNLIKRKSIL